MKKVLLAEDHGIVIKGIRMIFETEFRGYELDVVNNSVDLMNAFKEREFELIILDLRLEDGDIIHLVSDIRNLYPAIKVLIFSANPEEIFAQMLYKEGVMGYLSKQSDDYEIIKAIQEVLGDRVYMSEKFKRLLLARPGAVNDKHPLDQLTQRELHLANLMQQGKRPSEICRELNLQSSTVATYKLKIFTKLNITNAIELRDLFSTFGGS